MKLRKFMVLLLSSVLLIVTACSGSGNGGSGPGPEESAANVSPSPSSEAPPEASNELDFDMGGRVLKWVSHYDETIQGGTPDGDKRLAKLEELKKKHNFDLVWEEIDYGEYQDKVTASLIAGEPVGDIIRMPRGWMIPHLVKLDLFWPVDEYVSNEDVFLQQDTFEYSFYEGRGYGFKTGINISARGVFYNRTLMNQLGIKPLQEYVDEDNWNWETFIQVAKDANRDTDNDGKLDTWGLSNSPFNFIMASNTGANFVIDGKSGLDDPRTMEVLNFMSRLATEKVVREKEGGDWTEPKQFFQQGNTLMFLTAEWDMDGFLQDMPDYDIGFLPVPKGPSATDYHGFVTNPSYLTIPKSAKDPDKIVYLYEKINDIESIYDYPHQEQFEKRFRTEDDINNARMAVRDGRMIETIETIPNMPYYEITDEIANQGISVSTVIEKYRAQMDAAIAEVWGD